MSPTMEGNVIEPVDSSAAQPSPPQPPPPEGELISLAEAAKLTPYSQEYISLLARKGKLLAWKQGRNWVTSKAAVLEYVGKQVQEAEAEYEKKAIFSLSSSQSEVALPAPAVQQPTAQPAVEAAREIANVLGETLGAKFDSLQQGLREVGERVTQAAATPPTVVVQPPAPEQPYHPRRPLLFYVLILLLVLPMLFLGLTKGIANDLPAKFMASLKNAWTLDGHRAGTNANEVLILNEAGNISIKGHIETQGQLRTYARDGVAPIIVDSTTKVENLNADSVDGFSPDQFTLAFVTKNGNVTTDDVYLKGKVEVGGLLEVKGATKLLDALLVDGNLGVWGEAFFHDDVAVDGNVDLKQDAKIGGTVSVKQDISVGGDAEVKGGASVGGPLSVGGGVTAHGSVTTNGGDLNLGGGTINTTSRELVENLNAELWNGRAAGDFDLDYVTDQGAATDNTITVGGLNVHGPGQFFGRSIFKDSVYAEGTFTAVGRAELLGDTYVTNLNIENLNVPGSTTLSRTEINGTLDINAQAFADNLSVSGALAAAGSFGVGGEATIGSDTRDNLTVEATSLFKGAITANQSVTLTATTPTITTTTGPLTLQALGGATGSVQVGSGGTGSTTPDLLVVDVKSDAGDPTGTEGAIYYNDVTNKFRCFEGGAWSDCVGAGGAMTLQGAYDGGNAITTTTARDISFTLADTLVDANLVVNVADGSTSTVAISRMNGAGTADPAQLLLLDNLDLNRSIADGLRIQSAAGLITDGIDASDAELVNALNVGDNSIVGTTPLINLTNFDVDASGNITIAAGSHLISGANLIGNDAGVITVGDPGTDATLRLFGFAQEILLQDGDISYNGGVHNFQTGNVVVTNDVAVNGGDLTTTAGTFNLVNAGATTVNIAGAGSTINLGPSGATASTLNFVGGSGATGCTADGATGNFTCSGNITSTGGTVGFWQRTGTTLSPATANDVLSITGNTGDIATITSTATGASNKALNISQTGATAGTDYGAFISNTGAATTNVGLYATATGATNNYAAIFDAGNVGIGDTAPTNKSLSVSRSSTPAVTNYGLYVSNSASNGADDGTEKYGAFITNTGVWQGATKNLYGLRVSSFTAASPAGNNYALYVDAPSGATNNYGAIFAGGNVGVGDTTPLATLTVGSGDLFQVAGASGNITTAGDVAVNGGDITTTAVTFNLLAGATSALNVGPAGATAVSINLAGGSGDTGCTVAGATGNFTCSGNITGAAAGTVGYWSRASTTLSPATANDIVSITTNNSSAPVLTLTSSSLDAPEAAPANSAVSINATVTTSGPGGLAYAQKILATDSSGGDGFDLYGQHITATGVGTAQTVVGLYATATGGALNNYAAIFEAGNVGIGDTTPTQKLTVTGNGSYSTYLRVGSETAPANTTAGDLTSTRLSVGNATLGTSGQLAIVSGTLTDTAAGAVNAASVNPTLSPGSASSSSFLGLKSDVTLSGANNFASSYSLASYGRFTASGNITTIGGIYSSGFYGSTSTGFGTVTDAYGGTFRGVDHFTNNPTGTVTNATSVLADNQARGGAGITITNARGVVAPDQTLGANNTNILVGTVASPAGNYSIYNSSAYQNYFAGNVGIKDTDPSEATMSVTGTIDASSIVAFGSGGAVTSDRIIDADHSFSSGSAFGVVSTPTSTATMTALYDYYSRVTTSAAIFTLTDAIGYYADNATLGAGSTITNQYGLFVADQTSGASDYGISIAGADTQVLWLSSGANNTDAANGIAFGSSRDLTLYRGAANNLFMGDADTFVFGGHAGSVAYHVISNAGGSPTNGAVSSDNDLYIQGDLELGGNLYGPSTGTSGYWARSGTTLSPATANDIVSISSNNTSSSVLALTSTGVTSTGTSALLVNDSSAPTTGSRNASQFLIQNSGGGGGALSLTAVSIDNPAMPTTVGTVKGLNINIGNAMTTTVTNVIGIDMNLVSEEWSGGATNIYGGRFATNFGTTSYGIHVSNGGDCGTCYGAYLAEANSGATKWGLYDTTAKSYFAGNVGIGDTTPDAKLEILSSTTPQLLISNTDATQDTSFSVSATGDITIDGTGTGTTEQLILANADVINIGGSGSTDVAYNVIGDSTAGASGTLNSDDDLYIEGNLEVEALGAFNGSVLTANYGVRSQGSVYGVYGEGITANTSYGIGGQGYNNPSANSNGGAASRFIGGTGGDATITVSGSGGDAVVATGGAAGTGASVGAGNGGNGVTGTGGLGGNDPQGSPGAGGNGGDFTGGLGGLDTDLSESSGNGGYGLRGLGGNVQAATTPGTPGTGVCGIMGGGSLADCALGYGGYFSASDGSTNVRSALGLMRLDTNSAGAAGLGTAIEFFLEDSASAVNQAARIDVAWEVATNGSEESSIRFNTMDNGALSEKMRIDDNGFVGINSTGPSARLEVDSGATDLNSEFSATGNTYIQATNGTKTVGLGVFVTPATTFDNFVGAISNHNFSIRTNNVGRMFFDTSGNVGIADTTPDSTLEILSTAATQFRISYTDTTQDTTFSVSSTGDLTIDGTGTGTTEQVILANGDIINIGGSGSTDVAYNVIGDSTTGASANMDSDDDLYIEGNLEVDGTIYGHSVSAQLASVGTEPDNMVRNGNFEYANVSTTISDNWSIDFETAGAGQSYSRDCSTTANIREGACSQAITAAASNNGTSIATDAMPVQPGQTYVASVQVLGNFADGFYLRALYYAATGATARSDTNDFTDLYADAATTASWATYQGTFTVPSASQCGPSNNLPCTRLKIALYHWNPVAGAGTRYYDGLVVRRTYSNMLAGLDAGTSTSTSNVGIGTSTITGGKLNVTTASAQTRVANFYSQGTDNAEFEIGSPGAAAKSILAFAQQGTGTRGGLMWNQATSVLSLFTGDFTTQTNRISIDSAGEVGIGTDAPLADLDIDGGGLKVGPDMTSYAEATGRISLTGASGELEIQDRATGAGTWSTTDRAVLYYDTDLFRIHTQSTDRITIDSNGDVGIGLGSVAAAARLEIDAASNTSGIRLKGLAETTEIADIWVDAAGQLVISTVPGGDTQQYIDLRPEDNEYGLILRESDGTGTAAFLNTYVVDSAPDYVNMRMTDITSSTAGFFIDEDDQAGVGISNPTALFHLSGYTPASVGTSPGTAADNVLTALGGTGGATTIGTTGVGGVGGAYSLTGGTGGVANSAATSSTGGVGGAFTVVGGVGGAATVAGTTRIGGAGGVISLTGGVGGAATGGTDTGGAGGSVSIGGGDGGSGDTGGVGGDVFVVGGAAGTGGSPAVGDVLLAITSGGTARGNVGVGTTAPGVDLHISMDASAVSTPAAGAGFALTNSGTTGNNAFLQIQSGDTGFAGIHFGDSADNDQGVIEFLNGGSGRYLRFSVAGERMRLTDTGLIGLGSAAPEAKVQVTGGGLCVGSDANCNSDNNTEGIVYSSATAMTLYDLAENYPTSDLSLVPEEVVALDTTRGVFVKRATKNDVALGVISAEPSVLLGGFNGAQFSDERQVAVALSGRIPVRFSLENGEVAIGDYLTASSIPGVAMKATTPGYVIGIALEPYTPNDLGTKSSVMMFVNRTYFDTDTGSYLSISGGELTGMLKVTASGTPLALNLIGTPSVEAPQSLFDVKFNGEERFRILENGDASLSSTLAAASVALGSPARLAGTLLGGTVGEGFTGMLVEFKRGAQTMFAVDGNGVLQADTVKTRAIVIDNQDAPRATIGGGVMPTGSTSVTISAPEVRPGMKIFLTPKLPLSQSMAVTQVGQGNFTVSLAYGAASDVPFDWWVVDVTNPSLVASTTEASAPPAPAPQPAPEPGPAPAPEPTPTPVPEPVVEEPTSIEEPAPAPEPTPQVAGDSTTGDGEVPVVDSGAGEVSASSAETL